MAEPAFEQEQQEPKEKLPITERLRPIVAELERRLDDRIGKREIIEQRWLEDLRQFHGAYDAKIEKELTDAKKSKVFINQTRSKTNACDARLGDMLFPTDDRNYGIQPTPVPELAEEAEAMAMAAAKAKQAAAQNPESAELAEEAEGIARASALLHERMEQARRRARLMEDEIDDHLRQCNYAHQARMAIRDACRLGTGIIKGPVTGARPRRTWRQVDGGIYQLEAPKDERPSFWRVDPWNFFPDPDAHDIEDSEGNFERHLMNRGQLRKLARRPGFSREAIRRLLNDQPRTSSPSYLAHLREITGAYHEAITDRYHVWEYHGTLPVEEMRVLAEALSPTLLKDAGIDEEEIDPLDELDVIVWGCQGELLKIGIHPLDSCEPLYSVFNLEKDEASIFGFGIPYLMRDSQKALNSGWRVMLDNAGLSSGPQIVVNPEVIEPVDGDWTITARKLWRRKATAPAGERPFETYNIEMHQAELANIIEMARQFIDDETNIPVLAQGEQGSHVTQTAHGMSILMNSVSVVFRRIVKNWDDDMTTRNIRKIYDWLMQHSSKPYIKGDYEVDARGSSVLLVKEMQSANLLNFLQMFAGHPILGRYLKEEGLPALRRLVQTMLLSADELIKSDDEIAQDQAAAAEQPPMPDPVVMKIEADMNRTRDEIEGRKEVALIQRETALMTLAATHNMKLDELRARLLEGKSQRDSKERIFAAEAAVEERRAARGEAAGSGGYI